MVALDIKTGRPVWKSKGLSERSAYCSLALLTLNGRRQVVTMLEDHAGLDAQSGEPSQRPHRNKHAVHPNTHRVLCGKDRIFISSGYALGSEILEIAAAWSSRFDR